MLNYEEELKKFKPSLEVEDIEDAVGYRGCCISGRSFGCDRSAETGYGTEEVSTESVMVDTDGLYEKDRISVQLLV